MSVPRVVVLGGSFAGITAAFDVKRLLKDKVEVVVVSNRELFAFIPSMIWVVPGWRDVKDVTFELAPALERKGIQFRLTAATHIDHAANTLHTEDGPIEYDYLVIATGAHLNFDAVPGIGPHGGYTHSVCNLDHALMARDAWQEFLKDPGPVVVGAAPGASCFGAGYEFVLNTEYALRKLGIRHKTPVTFVTSEPFLGHFGLGGLSGSEKAIHKFLGDYGIEGIANTRIEEVTPDVVKLGDGRELPYKFAMIIPPFLGIEAIRNSPGVGNAGGWIEVDDNYRHKTIPNIYAAGVSVAMPFPGETDIPIGAPKTAYMSEVMARAAAHNIVADIKNESPTPLPTLDIRAMCLLDAGDRGIMMVVENVFGGERRRDILLPGVFVHWGKEIFERYFMWKSRTGRTYLP